MENATGGYRTHPGDSRGTGGSVYPSSTVICSKGQIDPPTASRGGLPDGRRGPVSVIVNKTYRYLGRKNVIGRIAVSLLLVVGTLTASPAWSQGRELSTHFRVSG